MRRKRLEVRVSCVSFPRAEYHFHDSNGVRVGPVTQFVPGGWMNGTERDDVILDLISGPRCSQLSQLRPVDPKFLVNRRTLVHPLSTGYEWIFRIRVFLPHEKYPSSDFSRPRWTVRENVGFGEYLQTFCKIYLLSLNGILFEKKKKKKNISYLHFVWTMHYSKYGSIVILLHRNVRRSCVRNLDRIYLN